MTAGDDVIAWAEANLDVELQDWQKRMVRAVFDEPAPEASEHPLIGRRMVLIQPLRGLRHRHVTVLKVRGRDALVKSEFGNFWVARGLLREIR